MKFLLLNGPNLNLLGQREPHIYGGKTYSQLLEYIDSCAAGNLVEIECRQSNHEGLLIDWIQEAETKFDGIIINPAGYTHTSVAIQDALLASSLPAVEVHLSELEKREKFRHFSYTKQGVLQTFAGLGFESYCQGIIWLKEYLIKRDRADKQIEIREYEEKDWPHLQRIYDRARNLELSRCGYEEAFTPLHDIFEAEELFKSKIALLIYENEIRGFVAYRSNEITWLYVDVDFQRRGFGQRLLYYALQHTARPLDVWLLHGNLAARELYQKVGFCWAEERKGKLFCPGREAAAVIGLRYTLAG